ncbi:MAG: DUF1559 domain-containing protein [Pirellulaceae bacterium]|nr:DUF1559 domain-containing protein [Pirellulaceae bacterium]
MVSFRSRHLGGANFCLADASAVFISQAVDDGVYRALSTKNGGESATLP